MPIVISNNPPIAACRYRRRQKVFESLPDPRGQGGGPHGEEEGKGGPGEQRPGGQALPGQKSFLSMLPL